MVRLLRLLPVLAVSLTAVGAIAAPAQAAAAVTFTPTSLTFASQATGTTSAAQTITATNTGTVSLFFNNVNTSGGSLHGLLPAPGRQSCRQLAEQAAHGRQRPLARLPLVHHATCSPVSAH